MPGVPSGRGCDACRKQKKKCDQAKPACSRCTRLQIPCEGSGKQRFTFKEQKIVVRSTQIKHAEPIKDHCFEEYCSVKSFSRSPSNEETWIASAFTSTLEIRDPRYDIACYGIFLKDIPKRLGKSKALDASVEALTAAFPSLYTRKATPDALTKYGNALKILRTCMSDPEKAQTMDTLCAIYLTMICQIWIGRNEEQTVSHGEVMAHILNALAVKDLQDQFELEMFVTLAVVVILEKIINPRIQLSPKMLEKKLRLPYGPARFVRNADDSTIESLQLQSLSRIPDLMHHPELHLEEITLTYARLRIEIPRLRRHLDLFECSFPIENGVFSIPPDAIRPYAAVQTAYVLLHFLAMVLNGILSGYDPYDSVLIEEAATFARNLMQSAHQIAERRPLGASYIPMCLTVVWAWASTNDLIMQAEVEGIWSEYQQDFQGAGCYRVSLWIRNLHHKVCSAVGHWGNCGDLLPAGGASSGVEDIDTSLGMKLAMGIVETP